jgi:sialate O-acetylesterase
MKKVISFMIVIVLVSAICIGSAIYAAAVPGDMNGDDEVNNKDVVTLFRYVSSSSKEEDESVYDFNGDTEVNNKDVVALFRAVSEVQTSEGSGTEEETEEIIDEEFTVTPDPDAELSVPRVIAEHMVLQRDTELKIWGTSNRNGALVRGQFMGEEAIGRVKDGKWEIKFSPKSATFDPQTLVVEDSCGNRLEYTDILVGDVWLIGGQSNAEATSKDIPECYSQLQFGGSKPIRILQQGARYVIDNPDLAAEPSEDIINPDWKWGKATRINVPGFSLLGWFFGDKLAAESGVPIGVVSVAASGSAISELMPKELSDSLGITVGTNRYYNALIHPFLKMKFTGLVFFQGESEGMSSPSTPPGDYAKNFKALMTELRGRWGFDFPIYNIQLTDYTEQSTVMVLDGKPNGGYAPNVGIVRAQQYDAYKDMEGVTLIASYDLGADEGYNVFGGFLHAPYKKELGERVADRVLAEIYGAGDVEPLLFPEPVEIKIVSIENGEKTINVKFKNVGEGLIATDGGDTVTGFASSRAGTPTPASLKEVTGKIISPDTVQLTVSGTAKSVNIGYACMANIKKTSVKLVSSYGMPALAFYLPAAG